MTILDETRDNLPTLPGHYIVANIGTESYILLPTNETVHRKDTRAIYIIYNAGSKKFAYPLPLQVILKFMDPTFIVPVKD
jgi:hypothetical protein